MDDSDNEGFVPILPKNLWMNKKKQNNNNNNKIHGILLLLMMQSLLYVHFKDLNDELSEDSSSNDEQEDRLRIIKTS
eukprot:UN10515